MSSRNNQLRIIIGKTIKSLRIERGISQEDLAGLSHADRSYISLIERGKNEPSVTKLFEICDGLNIKPSSLFQIVETEYRAFKQTENEE